MPSILIIPSHLHLSVSFFRNCVDLFSFSPSLPKTQSGLRKLKILQSEMSQDKIILIDISSRMFRFVIVNRM